jgi:hypothetical protein
MQHKLVDLEAKLLKRSSGGSLASGDLSMAGELERKTFSSGVIAGVWSCEALFNKLAGGYKYTR